MVAASYDRLVDRLRTPNETDNPSQVMAYGAVMRRSG
jgi:hypothetical protein